MFSYIFCLSAVLSADAHLPPVTPWHAKSEQLIQSDPHLRTHFETTNGLDSPDYKETNQYLTQLVDNADNQFKIVKVGTSAQGRAINMLIAKSTEGHKEKPTILIQAGIHAGEIDGKDAGFMLLRDIAKGKRNDILNKVNILFIPILNVDGHERSSLYNRINQRGPINMGFRTNANNLNLNRDYTKLETPGIQALISVVNKFKPDLYIDVHVTDGADYQYDITYGHTPSFASGSPEISKVLENIFTPEIDHQLLKSGHIPGPLVFVMNKRNIKQGLAGWVATPRFSNGWGDLRNLPTILVENHSLKPYKQRVLGTYVFLDAAIDSLAKNFKILQKAVTYEKSHLPERLVLERSYSKQADFINFKGIAFETFMSELSGTEEVRYTGKKETFQKLPIFWQKQIQTSVIVPKAYYIPPHYSNLVHKLKLQGINVSEVSQNIDELSEISITEFEFEKQPFEGRMRVSAKVNYVKSQNHNIKGWYQVNTDQALGKLAVHLLQPEAIDSFFQWGYFNTIFQRTEYVENYALIPLAEDMLMNSETIRNKFNEKLKTDKAFENNAQARISWLYQQTPFYDREFLKYPILIQQNRLLE